MAVGASLVTTFVLNTVAAALWPKGAYQKCRFATAGLRQSADNIAHPDELAGSGAIRAVVDSTFPLEELAEGHRRAESGREAGSVFVTV